MSRKDRVAKRPCLEEDWPMRMSIAACLTVSFCAAAAAQGIDDGRFQIEAVGENVLRLDRLTGKVEVCAQSTPTFVCRTVVEPAEPLSAELPASGAMLAENEKLKAENRALRERLAMIAALVEETDGERLARTTDIRRDIDEAVEVTDYAFRRFRDLFTALGEDRPQ
ncbi:MAG: hypothetical protein AAFW98_17755 [Pseudomonadota bacterium]